MGMLRSPSHLYQDHLGSARCWLQPNNAEQDETPPIWGFPANAKGHMGSQTGKGAMQGQEGFTVGAWKSPNGGYQLPPPSFAMQITCHFSVKIYLPSEKIQPVGHIIKKNH